MTASGTASVTPRVTVVGGCQVAPRLGDLAANRDRVAAAVEEAVALGAGLLVLPELVSSGYVFEDRAEALSCAEPPDGPFVSTLVRLAKEHGIVLVSGFCERSGETSFNSSAVVDPSGLRAVYRKAHLWDRERLVFDAGGEAPPIVDTHVGRVATMVCYDLEFPEWVRLPALGGAQLLAAPVNWPVHPAAEGDRPDEVMRVQADAAVNRMPVVACDRVGEERGVGWVGATVVTNADGWVVAGGWGDVDEKIVLAEVDLSSADDKGIGGLSDIHADRRPELYKEILRP